MQIPTFSQNLQELHSLKQELLSINHIFSPNSINYHQLQKIKKFQQQSKKSQQKVQKFEGVMKNQDKKCQQKLDKIEKQRKQLEDCNLQLVGWNQKLVQQLQATSARLEKTVKELEAQRHLRKELEVKYHREIQNLKLMHSQELYILKKKDKKLG